MFTLREKEVLKKWEPVLIHESVAPITDYRKRVSVAYLLENSERELGKAVSVGDSQKLLIEAEPINTTSDVANFDPVLISLVRRSVPNLNAYDLVGTQTMSGPTGIIFAMRSMYANSTQANVAETFYNEVNTSFSSLVSGANTYGQDFVGTAPAGANQVGNNQYNTGTGMTTANAEALGQSTVFPEMAFTIEKVTVTAKSRALKAEYSIELAQDLKSIHGLDAETELSNILSTEILAEINREIIRTINIMAVAGAQENVVTAGIFDLDTDSNGRWMEEKFKGMLFQIDRECNAIAKQTRRGKGNVMICSSDVASALNMAGKLLYAPAIQNNDLNVDDTGSTFVGILNGRIKVHIDPYAIGAQYWTTGYKGASPYDAGIFYCPYVPLQMVRAVDPNTFQPKIGFKTRYGVVANPFAQGLTVGSGALNPNTNLYYRKVLVNNLM
jgi:hypothetical protein